MSFRRLLSPLFLLAALGAQASELPPAAQAKLLKIIAGTAGSTKISCSDAGLKAALEAQGVAVDTSSPVVWATNATEARSGKFMGRLVVAGSRDLLSNASIVIEEVDGRPKLLLNLANLKASKVQVSDAIMKIGEKI